MLNRYFFKEIHLLTSTIRFDCIKVNERFFLATNINYLVWNTLQQKNVSKYTKFQKLERINTKFLTIRLSPYDPVIHSIRWLPYSSSKRMGWTNEKNVFRAGKRCLRSFSIRSSERKMRGSDSGILMLVI